MDLLQFIFQDFVHFVGVMLLTGGILDGLAKLIRAARGTPEPAEGCDALDCAEIIESAEGGIYKRIDENRELVELLSREAPELCAKFPWMMGWLRSQDEFLVALSETDNFDPDACGFKPREIGTHDAAPRPPAIQ